MKRQQWGVAEEMTTTLYDNNGKVSNVYNDILLHIRCHVVFWDHVTPLQIVDNLQMLTGDRCVRSGKLTLKALSHTGVYDSVCFRLNFYLMRCLDGSTFNCVGHGRKKEQQE